MDASTHEQWTALPVAALRPILTTILCKQPHADPEVVEWEMHCSEGSEERRPCQVNERFVALQLIHPKTFSLAAGIVSHAAEPITRLNVEDSGRFLFEVGEHYVLSPPSLFCSCTAFKYQVAVKNETNVCKHILAVQLALLVDATQPTVAQGPSVGTILGYSGARIVRDRTITAEEYLGIMSG